MVDRFNDDLMAAIDVRRQLEDTAATLEQELFTQEQRRVAKVNELRVVNGQVAELADRVAKARLRESALADKVTHWVQYLKEEKTKVTDVSRREMVDISVHIEGESKVCRPGGGA